ncbi:MAG: retroviral-like aspartic protease family protein [Spirochaetaceae bacterium]|jgi:clan AA aspartic protease|nr:retroviral-like aspartic protease family protein [Spirochaetaceae bacterium]
MGNFSTEITLKNAVDVGSVQRGYMKEQEVRQVTVQAVVDTGASTIMLDEETFRNLGLAVEGERYVNIADGGRRSCKITEPVRICWNDRSAVSPAVVIPGSKHVLLGAIPLEMMDLVVNPVKMRLEGAHGDQVEFLAL